MEKEKAYLLETVPKSSEWMELEKYAQQYHIPIMEPVSMHFLCQLLRIHQPETILEIGTAIGYSALRMAQALPKSFITTIERDDTLVEIARDNINKRNMSEKINIIHDDALEQMTLMNRQKCQYDFIFIDAAKGQYESFFTLAESLLIDKGIIVCDNILFRGYVADREKATSVRLQKLAKKIRNFNDWLVKKENYYTSIVPIGDGLAISVKR